MPIFIRCLGHLWGDAKFSQFGDVGDLAEDEWSEPWIPAGVRHVSTVLVHIVAYDRTAPHVQVRGAAGGLGWSLRRARPTGPRYG